MEAFQFQIPFHVKDFSSFLMKILNFSSVRNWISDTINAEDVKTVGKSKYSTNKDPIATMTRWRFAQKFEHTQFLQSGNFYYASQQNDPDPISK